MTVSPGSSPSASRSRWRLRRVAMLVSCALSPRIKSGSLHAAAPGFALWRKRQPLPPNCCFSLELGAGVAPLGRAGLGCGVLAIIGGARLLHLVLMRCRPVPERIERLDQRAAEVGQGIFDARRDLGIDG